MAKTYPVIGDNPPWLNLNELGILITVAGREVPAVISLDPVVGNVELGEAGFEAVAPYALCSNDDLAGLGDLHGAAVVIDGDNYVVRNVQDKVNLNYTRIILDAR